MSAPAHTEEEIAGLERELDEVGTPARDEVGTPARDVLVRTVDAELQVGGDGRTLDLRVVPYNRVATVADPPSHIPYQEMFIQGAFERQLTVPNRVQVWLNFEHEQGIRGVVGHGVELIDRPDGLHGSFRAHANADGDKALLLVGEKLLTGVSAEFVALRSRKVEGVVQRLRAHLDKVSLCRTPAYTDAQVLAVREALEPAAVPAESVEVELTNNPAGASVITAPVMAEGLSSRLSALGVAPLPRMATTSQAWDGSPSRFTDDEYRRSTLLCRGTDAPPKTDCSLPVLEPDGRLNVNALGAAAAALAGGRGGLANVTGAQKATAARKLIRYYRAAQMEPPTGVVALARA